MCKGRLDEGHRDAFKSNVPGSSFWLDTRPDWSLDIQAAAIADQASLPCRFPALTNDQGVTYTGEPCHLSNDDEETFTIKIEALTNAQTPNEIGTIQR